MSITLNDKKIGDPITAKEWNELVKRSKRELRGHGVITDDKGWAIVPDSSKKDRHTGIIVCAGPNGEPNPADETYWVQFGDILKGTATANPLGGSWVLDPVQVTPVPNTIVRATNYAEIQTHTHSLRTGTVVQLWEERDLGGNTRWVFTFVPMLWMILIGGAFNAIGMRSSEAYAILDVDKWDNVSPAPLYNAPNQPNEGTTTSFDVAYFEGTYWMAGSFSLDDLGGGPGARGYGLARWDESVTRWIGVSVFSAGDGIGNALAVWDKDGDGILRLYYAHEGATGVGGSPGVQEITFDQETKVVTSVDLGLTTTNIPNDLIIYDEQQDGTEKLYACGVVQDTPQIAFVKSWNGTAWSSSMATVDDGTFANKLGIHDFEETGSNPDKPNLIVVGKFNTTGGDNIRAFSPNGGAWANLYGGIPPNKEVLCCESFGGVLWAGQDGFGSGGSQLWGLVNGQGDQTAWQNAEDIVAGLGEDADSLYSHVFPLAEASGSVESLRAYNGKLMVGGTFMFRRIRRGNLFTGPLVKFNPSTLAYDQISPTPVGKIYTLTPWNGGIFVGGDYTVTLLDGTVIKNGGIFYDSPTGGYWEDMNGGFTAPCFSSVVFQGDLYAGGDFTFAGGVPVKGIARWDGSTWNFLFNVSDYQGAPRSMVVAGDRLIFTGDFLKVDGQAQFKIIAGWNGNSLSTVMSDIDAADGLPFGNALFVNSGFLYFAGWFDTIDAFLTAHGVTRMSITSGTWSALEDNDGPPASEGITHPGIGYSIGSAVFSGVTWITVGTGPNDSAGSKVTTQGLWKWNPTSPQWLEGLTSEDFEGHPVFAQHVKSGVLYVGVKSRNTFPLQSGGTVDHVYRLDDTVDTLLGDTGSDGFNGAVRTIVHDFAGAGLHTYVGGEFSGVGGSSSNVGSPAFGVFAINSNLVVEDVAGGTTGRASVTAFKQSGTVTEMRVFKFSDRMCPSLLFAGNFTETADRYASHLCGIDLRGDLRPVQAGLWGSYKPGQGGSADAVYDIKAIPEEDWPEYWKTIFTPCEPRIGYAWLICGSISIAVNNQINDADRFAVPEEFTFKGVCILHGNYIFPVMPASVGPLSLAGTCEVFNGQMVVAGGINSPEAYSGDLTSGSWSRLSGAVGAIHDNSDVRMMRVFGGSLYIVGTLLKIEADSTASINQWAMARWSGSSYTFVEPGPFISDAGLPIMSDISLVDLGAGPQLAAVGFPDFIGGNPVVLLGSGGWSSVGSGISGWGKSVTSILLPDGTYRIVVEGDLTINGTACQVAEYDGSSWAIVGHFTLQDTTDDGNIVGDDHGYGYCQSDGPRVLIASMKEIADTAGESGTPTAHKAFMMAQWRPNQGSESFSPNKGTNGLVFRMSSAGVYLFDRPPMS